VSTPARERSRIPGAFAKHYLSRRPSDGVAHRIQVRLYATARLAVGRSALSWPVPPDGITAQELVTALGHAYPRLVPTLRSSRFLRNDLYLRDLEERLRPGDEFAVHPPYGGG